MTVSVTMLQSRWGEDGTLWAVDTVHAATDSFATFLVTNGFASGTLPQPLQSTPVSHVILTTAEIDALDGAAEPGWTYEDRDTGDVYRADQAGNMIAQAGGGEAGGSYLGTVANEAAMLALDAVLGDVCYRGDTNTEWRCIALPADDVSAWRELVDTTQGHTIQDEGASLTQRTELNFTGAGVSVADSGGKTVITIPGGGGAGVATHLGTISAATMLATPSPETGWTCRVSDVGNMAPWFVYDGTNWRPLGGKQLAFLLAADTAQITTYGSLQAFAGCSCLFPAAVLNFTGASVEWQWSVDKAASAAACSYNIHFGSLNTSSDAAIVAMAPAADRRGNDFEGGFRRESATSIHLLGRGANTQVDSRFAGNSGSGRVAAATVDTLANATYLGFYANSTSEAVSTNRLQIYIVG